MVSNSSSLSSRVDGGGFVRLRRLVKGPIGGCDFVARVDAGFAEEVFVTMNAGDLRANGDELVAVFGTIDYVAGERSGVGSVPFKFYVAIVAGGAEILRSG